MWSSAVEGYAGKRCADFESLLDYELFQQQSVGVAVEGAAVDDPQLFGDWYVLCDVRCSLGIVFVLDDLVHATGLWKFDDVPLWA